MWRRIGPVVGAVLLAACQAGGGPTSAPIAGATSAAATSTAGAPSIAPATATAPPKPATMPRTVEAPLDGTCESDLGCLGKLEPGKVYTTRTFTPKFSFEVPSPGWVNPNESGGSLGVFSTEDLGDAIMFFARARSHDPAVGYTVEAISEWIQANEDVDATPAQPVSIGGLNGVVMDVRIAPGVVTTDPGCPVQACVDLVRGDDPVPTDPYQWHWDWGLGGTEVQRMYLLDANGIVVAIFVDSIDGLTFEKLTGAFDAIAPTIKFTTSGG